MNYNWVLKNKSGQSATGYHRIYEAIANGIPILATIYCLPNLDVLGNKKVVTVSVFWGCKKDHITKVFFHEICDDIGELIKNDENILFDTSIQEDLDVMFTQHYYSDDKQLPKFNYFNHGDYHIV